MTPYEEYVKWFERNNISNWLKVWFGLIITKRGLAPFVENTIETWKNDQVLPGSNCSACSTTEIVPCDPQKKICNRGFCKWHRYVTSRRCPNKVCDGIRQAIVDKHRFQGPSWRNTNASDWCSNAWEVAKAFMPPDGYDKISSSEETDLNGIVSVLINCLLFENYIPDLANEVNVATKVRDIGRKQRHASNLEVTDDELNQWFGDMRALLNVVPHHVAANSNAHEAEDQLNKLKLDQLHIERTDILAAIKDVVTSFEKQLKEVLLMHHSKTNSTLSLGPFFSPGDSRLKDFYVPPRLSKILTQMTCDQKGQLEYKTQTITSLDPLFTLNDTKQFTIITANAGVGKTAFCSFLAVLWCARHNDEQDVLNNLGKRCHLSIDVLKDICYLFCIDMNKYQSEAGNSVEDILHMHLKDEIGYGDKYNDLFEQLFIQKRGLVILDGLDESGISKLKPPLANRAYRVVITCRPWKLADMDIPRHTFLHVSIDVLDAESTEELFRHANRCLNDHYGTVFTVDDFFEAIGTQNLQSLTSNPMVGLQLYCKWHDRCMDGDTLQNSASTMTLGKTRSHIYADVLEMMFELGSKKYQDNSQRTQTKSTKQMPLPACFERCNMCKAKSDIIYETGKMAFRMLLNGINDQEDMELLQEVKFLQASGLITADRSHKCSIKNKVFRFLHKTYQELLAAVYLSSLKFENEDWVAFENHFEKTFSPDLMSFLCVMNYEQGRRCAEMFGDMDQTFSRNNKFYVGEIIEYQSVVLQAYNECVNNGVSEPQLVLRHSCIDNQFMSVDHYLLKLNAKTIRTCANVRLDALTERSIYVRKKVEINMTSLETYLSNLQIFPISSAKTLKLIWLESIQIENDDLDIVSCKNLEVLVLHNLRLRHVTIDLALLEVFSITTSEDLLEEIRPTVVTLSHEKQCANKLRELILNNIILNGRLDISQCNKLQKLRLDNLSFPDDNYLDMSSFTDLTEMVLRNICLNHLTIAPAQLEMFSVFNTEVMSGKIPPIEVTFAHREQYANKLRFLRMENIILNKHLDISRFNKLQTLHLNGLSFPDDYFLDISSFTDLTKVLLHNIRLKHVIIAPAQLEIFSVLNMKAMHGKIPPIEVTFAHGEQYSNKLQLLAMDNIKLNRRLYINQCDKLQILRLKTFAFPNTYHLDVSSFTDLKEITLHNVLLRHVTIAPAQLQWFQISFSRELQGKIPLMVVTFAHEEVYSSKLRTLILDSIQFNGQLDISRCDELQELRLNTLSFHDDFHLDISSLPDLSKIMLDSIRLKHLTIAPAQLEICLVIKMEDKRGEIPPIEVTFAHGEQFSSKLLKLSLDNTILNERLNISECSKLQELRLEKLSFPDDYNLDMSSFTDLSIITFDRIRLQHLTIAPAKLEIFWIINMEDKRGKIPPIEVTLARGEQFSGKLRCLSLENTILIERLSISQCDKLQELRLDRLSYPDDYHLDLSSNTDLTTITLQNLRIRHVTFAPTKVENFCVAFGKDFVKKTPPLKVTFLDGAKFTNKLKRLCLINIISDELIDISQCSNIEQITLGNEMFNIVKGVTEVTQQRMNNYRSLDLSLD